VKRVWRKIMSREDEEEVEVKPQLEEESSPGDEA